MYKKVIIIFILFLLIGCKAKKVYIETHSVDTIKVDRVIKITPAQLNSIVIDSPCDSLGNLKPFNYTLESGNDKLTVKNIHNKINIEQKKDSSKSVETDTFKSSTKTSNTITKVPYIPKWAYYSLLINVLFGAYTFRKFIPILKFIP